MHANPLAEPATLFGRHLRMEKHIARTVEFVRVWLRLTDIALFRCLSLRVPGSLRWLDQSQAVHPR